MVLVGEGAPSLATPLQSFEQRRHLSYASILRSTRETELNQRYSAQQAHFRRRADRLISMVQSSHHRNPAVAHATFVQRPGDSQYNTKHASHCKTYV